MASGQGFINAVPYRADMTPALEARELWKLYQAGDSTVEAVRGVNVHINAGEMVAVMGSSGCGKTTLLNILSGIDEPTAGSVMVNGQPLYGISDDARTDLRESILVSSSKISISFPFFRRWKTWNCLCC